MTMFVVNHSEVLSETFYPDNENLIKYDKNVSESFREPCIMSHK